MQIQNTKKSGNGGKVGLSRLPKLELIAGLEEVTGGDLRC